MLDMNILVVDDFATMRKIVKNLLKENGFKNITEAEDGALALQELKRGGYHFVISDWNMPNMTGIEMLKEIRKDPLLKDIPVLLVTAEARKEQIIEAATVGVNGYIVKPFTAKTLLEKIQKILQKIQEKVGG